MAGVAGTVTQRVTAETVKEARALWDEGYTTTVIGQKMGRSKNAICSIARRFDFPIRETRGGRPKSAEAGQRSPQMSYTGGKVVHLAGYKPPPKQVPAPPAPAPPVQAIAAVPALLPVAQEPPPAVFKPRAFSACCWPMWGTERPTQRFCDAKSVPGKPYCVAHCRIAYRVPEPPAMPSGGPVVVHQAVWSRLRLVGAE